MIKLFSRIRQKLLNENRFSKYLIYAIGEIVLVVIGILIALQVNNWNENRKALKLKNIALQSLNEDVKNDIRYLKNLDSIYALWNIQAMNIYTELVNKRMDKINTINEFMVGRGSMNHLAINTKSFNQMKGTGLLYKIENGNLAHNINEYYEFSEIEIEKLNMDNQEFYRYVLNSSGLDYTNTLSRIVNKNNLESFNWAWLKDPTSERYRKFESRLSFNMYVIEANRALIQQLIERAENVILAFNSHPN